jgi:shikimate kinase
MTRRNIILVGFMGTGKTTVGRLLARRFRMTFLDMDDVIEEREGRKISAIFADSGEAYFRKVERDLVQELSQKSELVIGTGGGIVLNPDNITDYSRSGLVVCLHAAPEVILRRVETQSHRPLLEGGEKRRRILDILETRRPLYAAIPHQVDTTALTPEEVAARIAEMYEAGKGPNPRRTAGT